FRSGSHTHRAATGRALPHPARSRRSHSTALEERTPPMNPTRPKIGFIWLPRSAREAVEIARRAEAGGFWGLGISDSPVLYQEMYPVISACLLATDRLVVGSNVTNPVTRHWTIHASTHRTYDELHPGPDYLDR